MTLASNSSDRETWLYLSQKIMKQHSRKLITFDEFAPALTNTIISTPDKYMSECVEIIVDSALASYAKYLKSTLEPSDFMPDPRAFMVGPYSDEEVERKKRELRPKYVQLYNFVMKRATSVASNAQP